MNKFKFYFMSVLACGLSFAFTACGDDDDDNKKSSSSESMNGGDIVGVWEFNDDASSNKLEGADELMPLLEQFMGGSDEDQDVSSAVEDAVTIASVVEFKDDKTFTFDNGEATGTYKTDGNKISMKGTSTDGVTINWAAGEKVDMSDMIPSEDDVELPEGAVDAIVKSINYNVAGDKLTISVEIEMTIDFSKIVISETEDGVMTVYDFIAAMNLNLPKINKITAKSNSVFNRK